MSMSGRMAIWLSVVLWLALGFPGNSAQAARPLARAEGTDLRVLVWNVSRNKFFEHEKAQVRVLRAIDADILILDEMPDDRGPEDVLAVLEQLRPSANGAWQVAYGSSGYRQRTVIALRGQISPLPEFALLPYPQDLREKLLALGPEQSPNMRKILDGGIATFGVEARIGSRQLLLVGVDLTCCGDSDDAWEEQQRMVEARVIRQALDQAWGQRQPDAVIVGGDFNAVRGRRPLGLVQGDPKSGSRFLKVAEARHANGRDTWTWDGRGTPYPSRPLDFLLHNEGLQLQQALVFDPETMTARERGRLRLHRDTMRPVSEHRPVVADFRWRQQ